MISLYIYTIFVVLVAIQRLWEMQHSKQNEISLKKEGALEKHPHHFLWMKLIHTCWLISCVTEAWIFKSPPHITIAIIFTLFFLMGQILRLLAIRQLKKRWTVRIIVIPGENLCSAGIYQYIRHPNYLGVAIEITFLPLIYGNYITAAVFTILNAIILHIRIHAEENALSEVQCSMDKKNKI